MFKKKNDLTEDLRSRLAAERVKLSELSNKLKELPEEDSENIEHKELYEKLIQETTRHIKKLEEQYENVSKIRFLESKLNNQEEELYTIKNKIKYSESDLTHLKFRLENKQRIISETEKEIAEIKYEIQEAESRLNELNNTQNELAAQRLDTEKEIALANIKANR